MFPTCWCVAESRLAVVSCPAAELVDGPAPMRQPPRPAAMTAKPTATAASVRRIRPTRLVPPGLAGGAAGADFRRLRLIPRRGTGGGFASWVAGTGSPSRSSTRVSNPAGGSAGGTTPSSCPPPAIRCRTSSRHASHSSRCATAIARSRPVSTPSASSAATSASAVHVISFGSLIARLLREEGGSQFLHAVSYPRLPRPERNPLGAGPLPCRHSVDPGHRHRPGLRSGQPPKGPPHFFRAVVGDRHPLRAVGHC